MQIDNTLFLTNLAFAQKEDSELIKAKIQAKPKEELLPNTSLMFNSYIIK